MPSDEERRKVAAALRTGGDVSGDGDFFDAVAFSLPPLPGKSNLTTTPTDLLHQITDLIDRPTCRYAFDPTNRVTPYRCTACGCRRSEIPGYCPTCGAEVAR